MKKNSWKIYTLGIVIAEAVGALSGWLSKGGRDIYNATITQPPLSPPPFVFPIVWAILYALMGISSARIHMAPESPQQRRGFDLYILQLIVNFYWSLIFFNMRSFAFAFVWLLLLWVLVLWMILVFRRTDPLAARLQIPYLIWLTFAAYLNFGVWYLNP